MITYVKDKLYINNIFVYTHGMFIYKLLNSSVTDKLNNVCKKFPENTQVCPIDISHLLI